MMFLRYSTGNFEGVVWISLFDLYPVLPQQPYNSLQRKPGLLHPVDFRINRIIECAPEICFFQDTVFEDGTREVAVFQCNPCQICFGKIDLLQGALPEFAPFQVQLVEGGEVEGALHKIKGKQEGIAVFEMEPQHFAAFEGHLLEGSAGNFGQAYVATYKPAFTKTKSRQVAAGKIAILESTVLVFPFLQWPFGEIFLGKGSVFDVVVRHLSKILEMIAICKGFFSPQ